MTSVLPRSWSELLQEAPCFVLGLERYMERSADACCRLQEVGFQRIFLADGVDGHARPAELDAVVNELWPGLKWKEGLSPGHRGCSLGHMRLWNHIATSGIPYGVIFEDDVLPHPRIRDLGPTWWAHTIEYEEGMEGEDGKEGKEGRGPLDMVLLGNQMNPDFLVGKEHIPVLESPAYCLHAYVLTAAGARKILDAINVIRYSGLYMYMNDVLVFNMMRDGMLNYVCWNRGSVDVGWPVFSLDMDLSYVKTHDVAVWARDSGLFYQNARWGTTLSGLRRSYLLGTADAKQDKEIKEYLRRQGEPV